MRGALIGACLFEGWADRRRGRRADPGRRRDHARPVPPPPHGRPDGRRDVSPSMWMWCLEDPVNGGKAFCNLNEGLGKVLRYGRLQRRRCIDPAALDARRARPGAVEGRPRLDRRRQRPDRRQGDPRPDAADGRRGAQPQPRRLADGAARAVAGDRRGRRAVVRHRRRAAVHRRQRALLPQPRHADGEARDGRRPRHPRLVAGDRDGPQRHRVRHPDRRHRRPLVHRPRADAGRPLPRRLRPGRRQPRHRRLRDHGDLRRRRLLDGRGARRSSGSSAAPCPTRWPPPSGCTS